MKKITIAIDGPSAAGKSTIAKMLAKELEYTYIDTGAMYRALAYLCFQNGINVDNQVEVEKQVEDFDICLTPDNRVILNKVDISDKIRTDQISMGASKVSSYELVRQKLVEKQREMAKSGGVIMDGRDVGTVVLPLADLKIYQIASVETRAMRRYLENKERGFEVDLKQITSEIEQRDYQDMNRKVSPLKKAEDAIEVDTSDLTLEQTKMVIMKLIDERRC